MANKTLVFSWIPGSSFTANVYDFAGGTVKNTSGALTSTVDAHALTKYLFLMTDLYAGVGAYVEVLEGANVIAAKYTDLLEVDGLYPLVDGPTAGQIAANLQGSAGGANTIVITVRDSLAVDIQAVTVTVKSGSSVIYTGQTNASGIVSFSAPNGTYTVNLFKSGFNPSTNSLGVNGDATPSYTMSALSITASPPPLLTGYLISTDASGVVESGISYNLQQIAPPDGGVGLGLNQTVRTATSGADGVVTFGGLTNGSTYRVQRETGEWVEFVAEVTVGTGSIFSITDCMNSVLI